MAELGSMLTVVERNNMPAAGSDVREHATASAVRAHG
jgi:hypothetical protein